MKSKDKSKDRRVKNNRLEMKGKDKSKDRRIKKDQV